MKRFDEEDEKLVLRALRSQELSPYFRSPNGGEMVQQLEREFAAYVGTDFAVAVSNGTTALHTAYLACGIKPNDRVIVPAHSFIATASMVLAVNAIPIFADVQMDTYCIDPNELQASEWTTAVVPVDLLGHPCDIEAVLDYAHNHHMKVIQDACQALGSEYHGKKVGSDFNDCAVWSAQFTKSWTSGEGGVVTTNDRSIAERCKAIRSHGSQYLDADYLTFNFRMSELHAAVGLAQLRKYPKILEEQRANAELVMSNLPKGVNRPKARPTAVPNWYIIGCTVDEGFYRQTFIVKLIELGISKGLPGSVVGTGYTIPLYKKPLFKHHQPLIPRKNAEELCKSWLWFDTHRFKERSEVEKDIETIHAIAPSGRR